MNVTQMLAHNNVTFEFAYEEKHKKPNFFMAFILKNLVKKGLTNEVPYKKNDHETDIPLLAQKVNEAFNNHPNPRW